MEQPTLHEVGQGTVREDCERTYGIATVTIDATRWEVFGEGASFETTKQ